MLTRTWRAVEWLAALPFRPFLARCTDCGGLIWPFTRSDTPARPARHARCHAKEIAADMAKFPTLYTAEFVFMLLNGTGVRTIGAVERINKPKERAT